MPDAPDNRKDLFGQMTPKEYVETRVDQYRGWYDRKARSCKSMYLWMRACSVVGGAIVPVLVNINLPYLTYVTTVVSLAVVVLVSLESVYHYREQWKNYRSTEQLLGREYFHFVTQEGPYRSLPARESFLLFVERVEGAIESENASTLNVMTTVSEPKTRQQETTRGGGA